jgi:transcriptional regulator with XRE-family HTH domain
MRAGRKLVQPHRLVHTLFDRLEEVGMSVAELSRKSGVSRTTIGNWRLGDHSPQVDHLDQCFAAVGLHLAVTTVPEWEPPAPLPPPQRTYKVRPSDVRRMKLMRDNGYTWAAIAERFTVSPQTVINYMADLKNESGMFRQDTRRD